MVAVAIGFGIVIPLGFALKGSYPQIPDSFLGVALGIGAPAIACVLFHFLTPKEKRFRFRGLRKMPKGVRISPIEIARQARIAELKADPRKQRYVALMEEKLEWWFDPQIEYYENRNALASCPHLQPMERGMREAGVEMKLMLGYWNGVNFEQTGIVHADCRINEAAVKRVYSPPECVQHVAGFMPERSAVDNPWAKLTCSVCKSTIDLVHPEWPERGTLWFPSAPVRG